MGQLSREAATLYQRKRRERIRKGGAVQTVHGVLMLARGLEGRVDKLEERVDILLGKLEGRIGDLEGWVKEVDALSEGEEKGKEDF